MNKKPCIEQDYDSGNFKRANAAKRDSQANKQEYVER